MLMKMHIFITITITTIMMYMMFTLKQKFKSNFTSTLNVECGFNSMTEKKFKFSNQFFMISILFVIFDMELVAIMPIPISMFNMNTMFKMMLILMMLMFSLLMEWMNGLTEWIK